jgi:hypothetical protein
MIGRAMKGLDWLKDNGREDHFINVYSDNKKLTFVLNNLETALLLRLTLE